MKIKEIRESLGYSQKDLAGLLGVSPSNIYNYENNRTEPSIDMLVKLSSVLNVSTDELIGIDSFKTHINTNLSPAETLSADEKTMLNSFRNLGPFEREAILIQIQALAGESVKVKR